MSYRRKLLPPMVAAAVVLIVVTNVCILQIVGASGDSALHILNAIWPIALPSSVAVILIMSALYNTLQEVIQELESSRQQAYAEARHDPLTGIPNKRLLHDRVQQAIARYRRTGEAFAVLMIDLDDFKGVNDVLGHPIGDRLLQEAAARLQSLIRETDMVARFGGDEFLVLQTQVKGAEDVRHLCTRIVDCLQIPYQLEAREVSLAASVGAALSADNFQQAAEYVRAADVALYSAKAAGRNCFRFFTLEMDARLRRRDRLQTDLKECLKTGNGISVKFQPQLDGSGKVIAAEALFRWHHPEFGDIPALEAVEIAEKSQLIDDLGDLVTREAARVARRWPSISVAVNVSPAQFSGPASLADRLHQILREEGVEPHRIELEITEQLFVREHTGCEEEMEQLRRKGFRLALDDFGTGYSSLSYLRRFKVDRLKLDKSFASNAQLHESVAVVRAAVTIAHSLGMEVVAEGIETATQERIALEAGCDALQGNRYSEPLSAAEFDARHFGPSEAAAA